MDDFTEITDAADLAGIGHNRPSDLDLLRERIEEAMESLASRLRTLREGIERAPAVISKPGEAENIADALRMVIALRQAVEERRKAFKAPIAASGKLVESLFGPLSAEIRGLEESLSPRLVKWLDAQPRRDNGKVRIRTQLGAVASLSDDECIVVESREAVDLEALRPHLDFEAVEKAARGYYAQHKSVPAGVRVEPVQRVIIR